MPRPDITSWSGPLFKRQLRAALDWLEANLGSGGGGGGGGGSIEFYGGSLAVAHPAGAVEVRGGAL